jgi:hypothetical protein
VILNVKTARVEWRLMTNGWSGLIAAAIVCAQLSMAQVAVVRGKNIRVEFDGAMRSRVIAVLDGREHVIGAFAPSETIQVSNANISDFSIAARKDDRFETSEAPAHVR